jgi:hypothetical protein
MRALLLRQRRRILEGSKPSKDKFETNERFASASSCSATATLCNLFCRTALLLCRRRRCCFFVYRW